MIIKKGEIILFSVGDYSDYSIITLGRAIEDLDIRELEKKFIEKHLHDLSEIRYEEHDKFVHFLMNEKQVIEELPFRKLHLGDYGELSLDLT